MKPKPQPSRQPTPAELQPVIQALNAGALAQAEAEARALLGRYPQAFFPLNLLGVALEQQGKFAEAVPVYRKALALEPKAAELHFNLGAVLARLGEREQAVASYRRALALKPVLAPAWFNLGIALQESGELDEAADCYRKATGLEPGFYEAWGNLGTVLQRRGLLEQAAECYQKAVAIRPHALGLFNLATALRDQGRHDEAAQRYLAALELDPRHVDAHNNLGEIFRDKGRMDDALRCYRAALELDPRHPGANYNMGESLYLAKNWAEAQHYFEASSMADAEERALDCLYRQERIEEFRERLAALIARGKRSTLLAMLSNHHAINYGVPDEYDHCPDPMSLVWHDRIEELATPGSPLLAELLRDIEQTAVAERKQGRLYYGVQSAGNLLKRSEPSFQRLASLVADKVLEYRERFLGRDCALISAFPRQVEFSSSWYIKMKQGGYLTSHIHEEGWISGCVYLALPREKSEPTEGAFAYGTDGDDYPRRHDAFPSSVVVQEVGDIVLFPSSLFHRTLPFASDEERVCVAFDIRPANALST